MEWGEEDMSPAAPTGAVRAAREREVQARRGAGEEGEDLRRGRHLPLPEGDDLWGGCQLGCSEGQQAFDGLRQEGGRARWGRSVRKCRGCAGKPGTLVRQERRGVRGVGGRGLESGSGPGCGDLDCQPRPRALELYRPGSAWDYSLFSPLLPGTSRLITGFEGFPLLFFCLGLHSTQEERESAVSWHHDHVQHLRKGALRAGEGLWPLFLNVNLRKCSVTSRLDHKRPRSFCLVLLGHPFPRGFL